MVDSSTDGYASDTYEPARDSFATNLSTGADVGAAFCATVDGETVVDLWGGSADAAGTRPWERDTIVNVYSTTKTMTALTAADLPTGRARLRRAGGPLLAASSRPTARLTSRSLT